MKQVIGHLEVIQNLSRLLEQGRLPHAFLFSGPKGVGKRTCALWFALKLFQREGANGALAEQLLSTGSYPDLHFLSREEEKRDIPVEAVREVISKLHLRSYYKGAVAIINDAHHMSVAASNALLMTLEEPRPGTSLILISDAPQLILPTILSRCQTVCFGELSDQEILQILSQIVAEKEILSSIAALCGGTLSPLQVDEFVHQKTSQVSPGKELSQHLQDLLRESAALDKRFEQIFSDNQQRALSLASELSDKEQNQESVWQSLRRTARRHLLTQPSQRTSSLLLRILEAERLVKERNLSTPLQLAELFLEIEESHREVP